jgi:TolB protein
MMMTRRFICVIAALLGVGGVALFESNAADVFLETQRSEFQKIPIWVMGFGDGNAGADSGSPIGAQMAQILKADLTRSQVFDVVGEPLPTMEFSQSHCQGAELLGKAKESGATVSSWGRVGRKDGKLVMETCAFDGGNEDLALGKRYVGGPITLKLLRLMVHRWADELVSRYTGDPGIARTKIVFVSEDAKGNRDLFVMDYDGFGPKQVTADHRLSLMPAWSPDQQTVAFTTYKKHNQEIVQLHLASGTKKTLITGKSLNITPAFSPKGKLLAFASATEGNSDIYTLDLTTQEIVKLTFDASADLSPAWSPNGREIAFTSDRGGRPQIYLMSADGSNVRRLTFEGQYNAAPAWSPRGDWIVHVCQLPQQGFKLCRITPDGQKRIQITSGPSSEIDDSPSWAPDGRHLVFSSTRGGTSHIYMVNMDGTGLEQLTTGGTHHSSPSWSPL